MDRVWSANFLCTSKNFKLWGTFIARTLCGTYVPLGNALGTRVLSREPLSSHESTCSHVYAHSSLPTWEQALGLGTLGL